jgi:error-prone DNA polymerase
MERNCIDRKTQDEIVLFISSFALYGFPESHAASFALIAYASAYLKCNYLAAFTAALLNNQPMGFYHPSTIVKDAQRHGLRVLPVDVMRSEWLCGLEEQPSAISIQHSEKPSALSNQHSAVNSGANAQSVSMDSSVSGHDFSRAAPCEIRSGALAPAEKNFALRLGLRYVRGLREEAGQAIVRERKQRPFTSVDDLARRVPELQKKDLVMLAQIGALNSISGGQPELNRKKPHRRDALWDVERVAQPEGPLLSELDEENIFSPLQQMTPEERLVADFHGTGVTVGPHPMTYHRARLADANVYRATDLPKLPNGKYVRVAGSVIARQRPGTASGFIFLSLEDETGIANIIVRPDIYDRNRMTVIRERFLLVEGMLQNLENVVSVKAEQVTALRVSEAEVKSHDFH